MKKSTGYYILKAFTWPMSLFPLSVHYLISDFLFFFVFHIFKYRRKVTAKNLKIAFPQKSELERAKIEKKFYRNLSDIFIETLYINHISKEEYARRLVFENLEAIEHLEGLNKSIIGITCHSGNWEFSHAFIQKMHVKSYFIYKKLNNKIFDKIFLDLRSNSGAIPLEMKQTFRQLSNDAKQGTQFMAGFLADQRPSPNELNHWINFFGHDTPVIVGPEKIARRLDASVFWAEIIRIKRGYYKFRFEIITEDAANSPEMEITKIAFRNLEECIQNYPDQWLWSHNRWKYTRN